MVHIERTPLKMILRAVVYQNTEKLSLSEIVEREKPDLAMTGAFYNPAEWAPVCPVKAGGTVLFADQQYSYWALGWDVGADMLPVLVPPGGESDCRNYVANCLLVRAGRPQQKLTYNADVGGRRGRVAVGLTKDTWITYGASDGSSGAMTPEELRDYMAGQGCQFAVMMDGGGKVNLYVKSENVLIQGKDPSQNLILLYLDDGETEEAPVSEKKTVCLDPGHDASNLANKSPDGTYYEHEFALDMGNRIKAILERYGVAVTMTRTGGEAVSLAQRCKIANNIRGLDLFVSLHSNAAAGSGWSSASGWSAYVFSKTSGGYTAAQSILEAVRAAGIAVRSTPIVEAPSLYVLKGTVAPAVLIEHGFHTNEGDVKNLRNSSYRQRLAEAEARGILDYLGIAYAEEDTPAAEPTEAEKAVEWITSEGIMLGNSAGDLMLDQPLTGKRFAVMLYRYHKKFHPT